MIVCVCRKVSEREVRLAVRSGVSGLDRLGAELGVATQCGRCRDCAQRILREELGRSRCAGTGSGDALAQRATASA